MTEEFELAVEVRAETEEAFLIFDGSIEVWLPKSQIIDQDTNAHGEINQLTIPGWLAEQKGLV